MASAPLRKQAGPVAATGPAGVPAVHKAAPQGADAHGGCRTRCALRRHAAPRGRAESGAGSGAGSGQQAAVPLLYALLGKEGKAVRRIAPVGLRRGRAKREQADGAQHKPQKQHEKTHFTPSFPKTQNNKNKTFHPI